MDLNKIFPEQDVIIHYLKEQPFSYKILYSNWYRKCIQKHFRVQLIEVILFYLSKRSYKYSTILIYYQKIRYMDKDDTSMVTPGKSL
jgi:hypothetical protein